MCVSGWLLWNNPLFWNFPLFFHQPWFFGFHHLGINTFGPHGFHHLGINRFW